MKNELGNVYGYWTVIDISHKRDKARSVFWICKCRCGKIKEVAGRGLRAGSKSCGCRKQDFRHMEFLKKYKQNENGCWVWQDSKDKNGYGRFNYQRKRIRAHRYSYEYFKGKIPPKMFVCHTCDNPSCVNPEHLWIGTPKENTQDMIRKGRKDFKKAVENRNTKGERHPQNKLFEKDVLEIYCLLNIGECPAEIARFYGITKEQIYSIRKGKTWKELYQRFMFKGEKDEQTTSE